MSNRSTASRATVAGPRIALIHALEESVLPARAAFRRNWPDADPFDLLDTSLAVDLQRKGGLDQSIMDRFQTLSEYAFRSGGQSDPLRGILFTCSAFGPAIDAVKAAMPIPVLRPNESAFREACRLGRRIGLLVTFQPSLDGLRREIEQMAAEQGRPVEVIGAVAHNALNALKRGDPDEHDRIALETASGLADVDVLVLGQFSLARAADRIRAIIDRPVVTTPDAAVCELKRLVLPA